MGKGRGYLPSLIKGVANRIADDFTRKQIDAIKKRGKRDQSLVWPEYVLIDEALALIRKVPPVYLWPCNCRAMMQGCSKPGFVCLRCLLFRISYPRCSNRSSRETICLYGNFFNDTGGLPLTLSIAEKGNETQGKDIQGQDDPTGIDSPSQKPDTDGDG